MLFPQISFYSLVMDNEPTVASKCILYRWSSTLFCYEGRTWHLLYCSALLEPQQKFSDNKSYFNVLLYMYL